MADGLRGQIRNNLDLKETAELLEIWQKNDHYELSDDAFELIKEILLERREVIPEQGPPSYQPKEKPRKALAEFAGLEEMMTDDENPPQFYDPIDVLKTSKQLEWVAKAIVVATLVFNLVNFSTSLEIARAWFYQVPYSPIVYFLAVLIAALNTAVGVVFSYFPLVALSRILKVLIQMEYNSRKVDLS